MSGPLRRPGGRWRLRVHHWAGRAAGKREGEYDVTHDVTSDPAFGGRVADTDTHQTHVIEGTEFDELVVGSWLHAEQLDTGLWWIDIGGVVVWVQADRDGKPKDVWVCGPDDFSGPRQGCTYRLNWGKHVVEAGQPDSGSATLSA